MHFIYLSVLSIKTQKSSLQPIVLGETVDDKESLSMKPALRNCFKGYTGETSDDMERLRITGLSDTEDTILNRPEFLCQLWVTVPLKADDEEHSGLTFQLRKSTGRPESVSRWGRLIG